MPMRREDEGRKFTQKQIKEGVSISKNVNGDIRQRILEALDEIQVPGAVVSIKTVLYISIIETDEDNYDIVHNSFSSEGV